MKLVRLTSPEGHVIYLNPALITEVNAVCGGTSKIATVRKENLNGCAVISVVEPASVVVKAINAAMNAGPEPGNQ